MGGDRVVWQKAFLLMQQPFFEESWQGLKCGLAPMLWEQVWNSRWPSMTANQPAQVHVDVKTTKHERLERLQYSPMIKILDPTNSNKACNSICDLAKIACEESDHRDIAS